MSLLTSDGLVEQLDKRGFRVSEVSLAEYDDMHRTRCWFEERALRESVAKGDQEWEDRLVLVHHRLRRLPRTFENETGTHSNPEWERMHKLFHMSLLSASPSKTLLQFCDQLHDRLNRYRSVAAVGAHAPRDWKTEHDLIAEAVLDRDADLAVMRLMQHYSRTTDILLETLTNWRPGRNDAGERLHPHPLRLRIIHRLERRFRRKALGGDLDLIGRRRARPPRSRPRKAHSRGRRRRRGDGRNCPT